jgi:hypothetical protein
MKRTLLVLFLCLLSSTGYAACSSVPFSFSPNTTAQSGQVNSNFAALVSCINAIDAGQITSGTIANALLSGAYTGITIASSQISDGSGTGVVARVAGPTLASPTFTGSPTLTGAGTDTIFNINNTSAAGHNWRVLVSGTGSGLPTGSATIQDMTTTNVAMTWLSTGKIQLPVYGAGTLYTDASGNISAAGANSIANPGYIKLPNGLIMQWGASLFSSSTTSTVTFPIAFPNTLFTVTSNMQGSNTPISTDTRSLGGVRLIAGTTVSANADWVALGN